jgi:plasmid maintenance system antidote protein VapI
VKAAFNGFGHQLVPLAELLAVPGTDVIELSNRAVAVTNHIAERLGESAGNIRGLSV